MVVTCAGEGKSGVPFIYSYFTLLLVAYNRLVYGFVELLAQLKSGLVAIAEYLGEDEPNQLLGRVDEKVGTGSATPAVHPR